jgi:hypothetical protein
VIKLQPGDYVMACDIKDEAMHNDLREAFREAGCSVEENQGEYAGCDREDNCIFWGLHFLGWGLSEYDICQRRVYPADILKKQTLFDAAKDAPDGSRFLLVGSDRHVVKHDQLRLIWADDGGHVEYGHLQRTDFEAIPDGPKKRDVHMAPVALKNSVMVPADCFADVIPAMALIGKLMQWEGAQIGKPGYRINMLNGDAYFIFDADLPTDITFETEDQCKAAWEAECPDMFK